MSEKPEALRLADAMWADRLDYGIAGEIAAELRRLHAENERLREALTYDWDQLEACRESLREHMVEIKRLREALEVVWQSQNEACARMAEDFNAWGLAEAIRKRGERHESP